VRLHSAIGNQVPAGLIGRPAIPAARLKPVVFQPPRGHEIVPACELAESWNRVKLRGKTNGQKNLLQTDQIRTLGVVSCPAPKHTRTRPNPTFKSRSLDHRRLELKLAGQKTATSKLTSAGMLALLTLYGGGAFGPLCKSACW